MSKKIVIPARLHAGTTEQIVTGSNEVYDDKRNKRQSEVNDDIYATIDDVNNKALHHADVIDSISSSDTLNPLSANQGRVLKGLLDAKVIASGSVPMDTEPTEGNTSNIVTSDGVYKAIRDRQAKRDTLANWTTSNPVLKEGEEVLVATDSSKANVYNAKKVGDGVHAFNELELIGEGCLQELGDSTQFPVSQKAVTDNLSGEFFIGKGDTYSSRNYKLIPGNKYLIKLKTPDWPRENLSDSTKGLYLFDISSFVNNNQTVLDGVTTTNPNKQRCFIITVPEDSDYVGIGGRANNGYKVIYDINNITELSNSGALFSKVFNGSNGNNTNAKVVKTEFVDVRGFDYCSLSVPKPVKEGYVYKVGYSLTSSVEDLGQSAENHKLHGFITGTNWDNDVNLIDLSKYNNVVGVSFTLAEAKISDPLNPNELSPLRKEDFDYLIVKGTNRTSELVISEEAAIIYCNDKLIINNGKNTITVGSGNLVTIYKDSTYLIPADSTFELPTTYESSLYKLIFDIDELKIKTVKYDIISKYPIIATVITDWHKITKVEFSTVSIDIEDAVGKVTEVWSVCYCNDKITIDSDNNLIIVGSGNVVTIVDSKVYSIPLQSKFDIPATWQVTLMKLVFNFDELKLELLPYNTISKYPIIAALKRMNTTFEVVYSCIKIDIESGQTYTGESMALIHPCNYEKIKTIAGIESSHHPLQSGVFYENYCLVFNANGIALLIDMDKSKVISEFNIPISNYDLPHCNTASLGNKKLNDNSIMPLIYVSQWRGSQKACFVYDVKKIDETYSIELVQLINLSNLSEQYGADGVDFVVDTDNGHLISTAYKTLQSINDGTGIVICHFALPDTSTSEIFLQDEDVLRKVESNLILVKQDSFYHSNRIYVASGHGGNEPDRACITVLDAITGNVRSKLYDFTNYTPQPFDKYQNNIVFFGNYTQLIFKLNV